MTDTRTPFLKLIWRPLPNVPAGYAFIHRLFDIQIGNQQLMEEHWPTIQERLRERYDRPATEEEYRKIMMQPGDRLAYYDDGTIKVFKADNT
jgi:hypothetical protein